MRNFIREIISLLRSINQNIDHGGGTVDYKTDVYMDGDSRVVIERLEDGSTVLLDEHENPIVKRFPNGSTEYYDAYQSARLLIGTDGAVSINDPTAGTLAIAEAIMARATKHLLSWAGEGNPIKEGDKVLTHADLYDMLMNTPAFVVLVYADHAYHPNLVTATQIAFTCSYASTNGDIVVERVTITSDNAVSALQYHGVTRNSVGGISLFGFLASKEYSLSAGEETHATGLHGSAAFGFNGKAFGNYGCFVAGVSCIATGVNGSMAFGHQCNSAGGYGAIAEGVNTLVTADSAHSEGAWTRVTKGGAHADGAYNNYNDMEQGSYAHGCGSGEDDRKNSVLYVGQEVYILGVGGYDGTNHADENVKSLRQVLSAINLKLVNVPTD